MFILFCGYTARLTVALILGGAIIALSMAFLAPLLNAETYPAGEGIYELLNRICHQQFERVFFINGHPTALCARCVGGYLGIAIIGTLSVFFASRLDDITRNFPFYGTGATLLLIAVIEAIISVNDGQTFRFFSGLSGGLGIGLMFYSLNIKFKSRRLQSETV